MVKLVLWGSVLYRYKRVRQIEWYFEEISSIKAVTLFRIRSNYINKLKVERENNGKTNHWRTHGLSES